MGTKASKAKGTKETVEEPSIHVGDRSRLDDDLPSSNTQPSTMDNSRASSREDRKRKSDGFSPSIIPTTVVCSQKRDDRHKQREEERRNTKHSEEATQKTTKRERKRFRDGTHPDLPRIHRNYRERRIREDICIICLEGNADGKPVEMFSACCDQAYHVSCYIRQLSFDNLKQGPSGECGVCRSALPNLEDDGMYIKSFTRGGVSSVRAHRGKREVRQRNFLHSNDLCYNIPNSSSSGELRLYLFTR